MINIIKKRKLYKSKKQDHKVGGTFCMSEVDAVETAQNDKQCTGAAENGAWPESVDDCIAEKTGEISQASANDQYVKLSEVHIK